MVMNDRDEGGGGDYEAKWITILTGIIMIIIQFLKGGIADLIIINSSLSRMNFQNCSGGEWRICTKKDTILNG